MELVSEGIWVLDADDRTTYLNPVLVEMLGFTVAEMVARPLSDFIDADAGPAAYRDHASRVAAFESGRIAATIGQYDSRRRRHVRS